MSSIICCGLRDFRNLLTRGYLCMLSAITGMAGPAAQERVRERIRDWVKAAGHGSQRKLAARVPGLYGEPRSDQWISDILNRRSDVTLRDLDAVADAMDVPPGELVRRNDRNYLELTMAETRIVHYFRVLPYTIRQHWLGWLDFIFGDRTAYRAAGPQRAKGKDQRAKGGPSHGAQGPANLYPAYDPAEIRALAATLVALAERSQPSTSSTVGHLAPESPHRDASGGAPPPRTTRRDTK